MPIYVLQEHVTTFFNIQGVQALNLDFRQQMMHQCGFAL